MKDIPLIFSAAMVLALLERRKTVTRRLDKRLLRVKAGMRLWVRESLYRPDGNPWSYRADDIPVMVDPADEMAMVVWAHHKMQDYCPSIHMPRWASRITLEATEDARMERLQDITDKDARLEGMQSCTPADQFRVLWDSLHAPKVPWSSNPEVVRIAFRRLT